MIAVLVAVLALAAPSPDPPPQACFQGWCTIPKIIHVRHGVSLPGLEGRWDCTVGRRWTYCVKEA